MSAYGGQDETKREFWFAICYSYGPISRTETDIGKSLTRYGSAGTIFKADAVGGIEYVYTKNFDAIHFDGVSINNFQVEIGNMEYGLDIEGIIGFDFIRTAGLVIDAVKMQVYSVAK